MELNNRLYNLFLKKAQQVTIDILSIGLGYTAVTTSGGGIGLAYTYFQDKTSCVLLNRAVDYENRPCSELLECINGENTIERSMALALVNAPLPQVGRLFLCLDTLGDHAQFQTLGHVDNRVHQAGRD